MAKTGAFGISSTPPSSIPYIAPTGNSTLSSVPANLASVELLPANADRRTAIIYNDGNRLLYVKYGTTASATSFTVLLRPDDYVVIPDYNGKIDGIWNVANGSARITELTF